MLWLCVIVWFSYWVHQCHWIFLTVLYVDRKSLTGDSAGKESACNAGDPGSSAGLGRSTGEGLGYLFQYSGLENSVDCIVPGSQRVGHNWVTYTFTSCWYEMCMYIAFLFALGWDMWLIQRSAFKRKRLNHIYSFSLSKLNYLFLELKNFPLSY